MSITFSHRTFLSQDFMAYPLRPVLSGGLTNHRRFLESYDFSQGLSLPYWSGEVIPHTKSITSAGTSFIAGVSQS